MLEICEALVYDPKSNSPCWLHEGLTGSIKEEDLIPMEGSVIYLLDKSCILPEDLNMGQGEPKVEIGDPNCEEIPMNTPFVL